MNNAGLTQFLLHVGDSQLILSHRLAQWCGHAPELELDIALANIGLDLLGQARNALTLAGELEGLGRDEDQLAYFRHERDYRNLLLTEQPNGDFAQTMVRQWLMDHYHRILFNALTASPHPELAAFAVKSLKEAKYHVRFSSTWMARLSLGTELAHEKTQAALNELWRFTEELFSVTEDEQALIEAGVLPDMAALKTLWTETVLNDIERFELTVPALGAYRTGAKQGLHTEHLGYILAELQYMQRSYPNMVW